MLIQTDFENTTKLPPRPFLEQVMDDLSRLYCFLWDKKNVDNIISMKWKDIKKFYNKNSFRSNLRKLNNVGLLSYEDTYDGVQIELVGWDEMTEEFNY